MTVFNEFRDLLYYVLKFFQDFTEPLLNSQSYWFSIVLLTIAVRILLVPLTIKQIRSMRAMQELAPEMKRLQAKHKNDRQKLNEEMFALYREKGVNPMAGCWPLLAQMPFFFALYQVIYNERVAGEANILRGHTFFGVPLETEWMGLDGWADRFLSADGLIILGLIVAMAITTYVSQKQLMAKQSAQINPQQQMMVRILPLMFLVFSVNFPLAVVLYWVTTNLWSMGQQWLTLRTAPAPAVDTAAVNAANGGDRKGPGLLDMFRGITQQAASPSDANGARPKGGKGATAPRSSDKEQSGGSSPSKARQGGSGQGSRRGSGGGKKSGRSSGKGKASGQRRGKR